MRIAYRNILIGGLHCLR